MDKENLTSKLIDIAISLSSETNLNKLLEKIVLELRTFFHADGGSLYLRNQDHLQFEVAQNDTLRRQKGKDFLLFKPFEIPINKSSIAGYVALTGTTLNIPHVYRLSPDLPYHFNPSFDQRNYYQTQSLLAVPLKDQQREVVGVLELINAQDEQGKVIPFPAAWEDLVLALGSQAAIAINNARLMETLETLRAAERKRYHYHLEAIFKSVKDAVITLDKDMQILAINDAARNICGLEPQKIVGQNFLQVVKNCSKGCFDLLKKAKTIGDQGDEGYQECRRPSRPHQVVSLTRAPLKDHEDKPIGVVLVIRDLTREIPLAQDLSERYRAFQIIGKSQPMQRVYRFLDDLMPTDTTVLIRGETGTGKELAAAALHYGGPRRDKPLVKVNCSALAENLLESELFGHVRGAFTGAHKDAMGRFQTAHGGTIFLDEIGDIPLKTQVKLLRVIEDKRYERVGESSTRQADVRIIAATHRDLRKMVRQGLFREDLYFRLKVFEVTMPTLRERLDDLPLLIEHFRHLLNQTYKKQVEGLLPAALEILKDYSWPGNVRELKHVLEHAFVQCKGSAITPDDLPADIRESVRRQSAPLEKTPLGAQQLEEVLNRTAGNKARAARLLGISRPTLYRLLELHGLKV
uniref:GAF domain-containing protein n=1 Tax=Desulfobacca acetoxidans TaxID=60893 RepID=A0A7C3V779_9BACT